MNSSLPARLEPWRIRPRPKRGEALSSWLVRIAEARGKLPHQLVQELCPGLQFWNRDGDLLAPPVLLDALAVRTGTPRPEIERLTLGSLAGVLDEAISGKEQSSTVRPLGVYHRPRRGHGQQYCAPCLATDTPFFRLRWRLTLFPACTRHGLILNDACHSCAAPVVPHRGALHACHACDADLRLATHEPASAPLMQLQHHNQRVLDGHAVTWPGFLGKHPLEWFATQHILFSRCASPGRSGRLRQALGDHLPVQAITTRAGRSEPRFMDTASAHYCMSLLELLLRGWPMMLASIAYEAGVFRSWIIGDERGRVVPITLADACATYLTPGSAPRPDVRVRRTAEEGTAIARAALSPD